MYPIDSIDNYGKNLIEELVNCLRLSISRLVRPLKLLLSCYRFANLHMTIDKYIMDMVSKKFTTNLFRKIAYWTFVFIKTHSLTIPSLTIDFTPFATFLKDCRIHYIHIHYIIHKTKLLCKVTIHIFGNKFATLIDLKMNLSIELIRKSL